MMRDNRLRTIAIAGGGLAGWMAAATLARLLKPTYCRIVLVEAPQDAGDNFAAAAIPAFQRFNNLLGIAERDFVQKTNATFKLGFEFQDSAPGQSYFHTFCAFGGEILSVPFHHYWRKARGLGDTTPIADYSIATIAAKLGRFTRPVEDGRSVLSLFSHAYHFDPELYAVLLRDLALRRGIDRIEGVVRGGTLRSDDGFIENLVLEDGRRVEADFFIDCTGFPGVLIEGVLGTGYEDWSRWLPCDRAVTSSASIDLQHPYTRVLARDAGWRVTLPLRNRSDVGYFYSSAYADDASAAGVLLDGVEASRPPRFTRQVIGRAKMFWNRNCLSLPGANFGPLEATNVHLIQTGILKLFGDFPDRSFDPSDSAEYNRLTAIEHERVRDFLVMHYNLTGRSDTPFWRHCRAMAIPDALRHKIDLFRRSGRVNMLDNEHFGEQSWISVLLGNNVYPERYDPLADVPDMGEVNRRLQGMRTAIRAAALSMPRHEDYIASQDRNEPVPAR